jgi:phosphatidylserine decarboxylase
MGFDFIFGVVIGAGAVGTVCYVIQTKVQDTVDQMPKRRMFKFRK